MECCVLVLKWQQVLVYIGFRYRCICNISLHQLWLDLFIIFSFYHANVQSRISYADVCCGQGVKHKISHMPGSSKACVSKIHMEKRKST